MPESRLSGATPTRAAICWRLSLPQLRQIGVELAAVYGRYGTPRITAMLRHENWCVNHKRVERIWREEGLKVPQKQPKRGRLWLNDGSWIRLRADQQPRIMDLLTQGLV